MKKNLLSLCLAAAMVLSASAAFADQAVPEHPCTKPVNTNKESITSYESCMAAFISAQKSEMANHEQAIKKAEAAMQQAQDLGDK